MSQFGVGAEWGTRVIAALSVVALTALGTMGCSKSNATFCEDRSDCEPGEVCSDNACEAGNFDAALPAPDASPSCPTASHQCLPSAPAEWSGPTMRAAFED
ncbi:MAG: hypothetical protein GY811_28905, partial [Myxococcales bacterium]|nr:hypothetical protein [Myxococcales bacterium]